jgi:dipeptidyl aminopeptidase/acylaminoacyl peptidase
MLALSFSCSEETLDESGFGTVKGRVVQAITFEPIANAKVSSNPNSSSVFTDVDGYYTIENIKTGDYAFEARKDGYIAKFEAGTVIKDLVIEVIFELEPVEEINQSPTTPVLLTPTDNATDISLSVNLTWQSTDVELDPLTYKVTLRNDITNEITVFEDITTASYSLTGLNYSTKYFWEVSVSDGINPEVNSLTHSFRTLAFPNARYLFTRKIGDNNVIYTADDAGNKLQITSDATNSFRPRKNIPANKIAFLRTTGGQAHIYTMNPDGSNVFKVTAGIPAAGFNLDHYNFSWKSNGSQLIYSNFDKLYKINADGSGLELIFQTPNGKLISECDWSIDSSIIAIKVNNLYGYETEIYVIDMSGIIIENVISGTLGAISGLHLSVTNNKLIYTRDITGFESFDYRQLDSRIFQYDFSTNLSIALDVQKPAGYNDSDVRYSPTEAELLFMSTPNDGLSPKNSYKYSIGTTSSRVQLYENAIMPDWK